MLDKSDLKSFHARLLNERVRLKVAIVGETESSKIVELDQSTMGRLSRMDALQGQAMTQETKLRHEEGLRKISAALSKMESNDFGYCLKCDESISVARLNVDPSVALCIACASLDEKN